MRQFLVVALLALPASLTAQAGTIAPGMNRGQVVAALGEPATARTANEFTYLFYRNDCGKACGMNDLVVLRSDSVIDAIFRSPSRHYTGKSSSPAPLSRSEARTGVASAKTTAPAKAAPSVPVTKPAAATTVATKAPAPAEAPAARVAPPTAIPTKKDVPVPSAQVAMPATRTPTPEQLATLRKELIGTGLSSSQIRARLKAQGYAESLLDADMRGAAAQSTPAPKMKPSAPNDTRPSIPANVPPVKPATPSTAP